MNKKREKLVYEPLYRMNSAAKPTTPARREAPRLWAAMLRVVSFGLIGKGR